MRVFLAPLLAAAVVTFAVPAHAVIGTADDAPAATLLIPYFEVDLDDPSGVTTLVTVQNSSASATLAHVTMWTDLGIPSLDFDIYLTGFDVQSINLRDVFSGYLPVTASAGQDPSDAISPKGPISQDINFASCTGILPYVNPALNASFINHLRAWHTGQQSPTMGNCAGANYGSNVARGYITIDVTNACSLLFPGDPTYFFNGGAGIAGDRNILVGDWMMVDPSNNFMEADRAVAIEASPTDPRTTTVGSYTFYGRLVAGTAVDNREPLPTTWGAQYMSDRSRVRVWRDVAEVIAPFNCAQVLPAQFPLNYDDVIAFDSEENPLDIPCCSLPYGALQAIVGSDVPTTAKQGWLFLNLNSASAGNPFGDQRQAWVAVAHDIEAEGRFSAGWPGVALEMPSVPVRAPGR